ncbi:hypothetical protein QN277_004997 [Acacia crassicarpa]|uniref:Uncharacterized protein n=1 Tax=Acacia crassicarpa TaxID=499986 RepID=A0AAE1IW57_9FABA|nr:hypothetical protein QN277_004997 [Acacia crassicarpa]
MSTFSDTEANGRRTGSNFSQTCNLFRQFLKEKRGCGAISLGMSGKKIEPRGRFNLCLGLPTKCLLSSGSSGPNRADALLVCSGAKTYPLFQSSSQTSSIKLRSTRRWRDCLSYNRKDELAPFKITLGWPLYKIIFWVGTPIFIAAFILKVATPVEDTPSGPTWK